MKSSTLLATLTAASLSQALSIPTVNDVLNAVHGQNPFASAERYLIELAPGETRRVTEDEKWQLRREGKKFFDITDNQDLGLTKRAANTVTYPKKTAQNDSVSPLLKELSKKQMSDHLETFTAFHTRYYRSDYGKKSSEWLLDQVNQTLTKAGAGIVRPFPHSWGQSSIIATLPGKSEKTIVIGAHQDSINLVSNFRKGLSSSKYRYDSRKHLFLHLVCGWQA